MRLQNFEGEGGGGGGQTRCIMGDAQMVNSHTSWYSFVPGLSLGNHKI